MREIGYVEVTPEQAKDPQKFIELLKAASKLGFSYVGYIPMGAKGGVLILERRPGVSSTSSTLCNL